MLDESVLDAVAQLLGPVPADVALLIESEAVAYSVRVRKTSEHLFCTSDPEVLVNRFATITDAPEGTYAIQLRMKEPPRKVVYACAYPPVPDKPDPTTTMSEAATTSEPSPRSRSDSDEEPHDIAGALMQALRPLGDAAQAQQEQTQRLESMMQELTAALRSRPAEVPPGHQPNTPLGLDVNALITPLVGKFLERWGERVLGDRDDNVVTATQLARIDAARKEGRDEGLRLGRLEAMVEASKDATGNSTAERITKMVLSEGKGLFSTATQVASTAATATVPAPRKDRELPGEADADVSATSIGMLIESELAAFGATAIEAFQADDRDSLAPWAAQNLSHHTIAFLMDQPAETVTDVLVEVMAPTIAEMDLQPDQVRPFLPELLQGFREDLSRTLASSTDDTSPAA